MDQYDPHYHADYWIAVATIAPVIGLAYLVLLTTLIRRLVDAMRPVPLNLDNVQNRRDLAWRLIKYAAQAAGRMYGNATAFALIALGATLTIINLFYALDSMDSYQDFVRPVTSTSLSISSLLILFISAVSNGADEVWNEIQATKQQKKLAAAPPDPPTPAAHKSHPTPGGR